MRKLTPLCNWVIKKQEAQMSTSLRMTSEELQRLVTQSFPVILYTVVFLGIVIIDFAFTTTLQTFQENAKLYVKVYNQSISKTNLLAKVTDQNTLLARCFLVVQLREALPEQNCIFFDSVNQKL